MRTFLWAGEKIVTFTLLQVYNRYYVSVYYVFTNMKNPATVYKLELYCELHM